MAYICPIKVCASEFDKIVFKKVQHKNINELKLEVYNNYKKDERIITNFQPTDDGDVIKKDYLDEKLLETNGHLSLLGQKLKNLNYTTTNILQKNF